MKPKTTENIGKTEQESKASSNASGPKSQSKQEAESGDPKPEMADTVYTGGKIYTVDKNQPWAEAVAIKGGKFIKVGSADDVKALIGEDTEVVDLGGKFVMPGFIDAHTHALNGADDMANLQIKQPGDKNALLAEIKAYADANPDVPLIRGASWNLGVFPNDSPPKELLDEIVPDRPVFLYSQSGHSAWLNSKALELAGITKDTPITKTFIYSKDPDTGEPTGRIDEYAMGHVEKIVPKTSPERMLPGIKKVQKMYNSYGVTTVKLAEGRVNWAEGAALMEKQGGLNMRIMVSWDWGSHYSPHTAEEAEEFALAWKDRATDMLDARSIKVFYDGAPDSYTALLLEDYEGRPGFKGQSHKPKEEFYEGIKRINANGIGVVVHVMGDGAARELVDIFAQVREENGDNDAILHLSHAVMARPEDLARLKDIKGTCVDFSPAIGVVAPGLEATFKTPIGDKRYQSQLNVRAAIEAGVPTGLGSDWPSSIIPEPSSFWYLQTWLTRKLPGAPDAETHNGGQAINLEQAIEAYTLGTAKCMGFDWAEKVGSIEAGKLADFIVLDRNLFDIPVEAIKDTLVDQTVLGGKVVFDRDAEEARLEVIDVEITNQALDNAIDAAQLNLLLEDELYSGACRCLGASKPHLVGPGATSAPDEVNTAFASLLEKGYRYARPARQIEWKDEGKFWIQWTLQKPGTAVLWAYDPDTKEAVEVLQVRDKTSADKAAKAVEAADSVYTGGKIYTVNEGQPWAEAVAIKDGKFIKVGSADDVKSLIADDTEVVDLGGKFAMPGLVDAHTHPFVDGLKQLGDLSFDFSRSEPTLGQQRSG